MCVCVCGFVGKISPLIFRSRTNFVRVSSDQLFIPALLLVSFRIGGGNRIVLFLFWKNHGVRLIRYLRVYCGREMRAIKF